MCYFCACLLHSIAAPLSEYIYSFIMDSDKTFFSTDFLAGFIEKYRSLPCLWKVKSLEYSNTVRRQKGWEELTAFCRKIIPVADITWVKRKVQNMRGSFRKELKKIAASKKSGAEVIYKPRLWYYDLLSFTKDDEASREFITIADTDDEDAACAAEEDQYFINMENIGARATMNDDDSSTIPDFEPLQKVETWKRTRLKRRRTDMDSAEEKEALAEQPRLDFCKQEDEYDAIGKSVAAKLRKIANTDYVQFIYADKLINDILYQATLGQLTPITTEAKAMSEFHEAPTSTFENWNITSSSVSNSHPHFWVNPAPSLQIPVPDASHPTGNTSPLEHKVFNQQSEEVIPN